MKIAYVANVRMPTEKAHGLQIMHMCRAFTLGGHDVTLIVPKRKNWIEKSIWEFYDAEPIFKIVEVPIVDFIVLLFVVLSGGMLLVWLLRALLRPRPPRRLLTLVIEERGAKRTSPQA